jgi:quinoprotein glucose dehydrogenase
MNQRMFCKAVAAAVLAATALSPALSAPDQPDSAEWTYFGGDHKFQRYSPLSQINAQTIDSVTTLWTRPSVDKSLRDQFPDISPSNYMRGTPLMVDGVLYSPNGIGLVEAFNAETGATIWVQQPASTQLKDVAGQSTRGVDVWRDGSSMRILSVRGEWLYALDAKDGSPIQSFGEGGRVSLNRDTPDNIPFSGLNGPLVVGDVIVMGGGGGGRGAGDGGKVKEAKPDDIRGYDVRTGKLLWTFHILPQKGQKGSETWGGDSASYTGHMSAWAPLAADDAAGLVYIPLTSPTNPYYGGHRAGDNLYANSLLALDAKTGRYAWHFQMVHHDLWDYDNASPPTVADLKIDGRTVKAVIQPNKTGYIFVFDRITGKPVWPIEERPVPQSTIPGEHTSPTQPFPTKPEPFDQQGVEDSDLIDFTPALKAEAMAIRDKYVHGPLFMPPTINTQGEPGTKGTIIVPGDWGTGNWNTNAFDPETGRFYAVSMTFPAVIGMVKNDGSDPKATIAYYEDNSVPGEPRVRNPFAYGPNGDLPLTKPPYGRITAYDMNEGKQLWMVANGDGPRNHPLLKDLNLPQLGTPGRPVPLVTKSFLFLGEGSDAVFAGAGVPGKSTFRAYDKATGKIVWQTELPAGTTGGPITYEVHGKQIILVPVGGKEFGGGWVALGIK